MIDWAKQLVAIESSPTFGTSKVCQFLFDEIKLVKSLEVKVIESELRGKENSNIVIEINKDNNKPGLLFVSHLDTTDPGTYGLWDKTKGNPFEMSIHDDICYGLGVTAKFNFLAIYEALLNSKTEMPITLVGTHSEEDGLIGIKEFLEQTKNNYIGAIVTHPTELNVFNEGLGISVFEIEVPFSDEEKKQLSKYDEQASSFTQSKVFRGKSAHSSDPSLGESAIKKMFAFLQKMPNVLVTSIDGGVLHNTVPEHSILEFVATGSIKNNTSLRLLEIYQELIKVEEKFKEFPHSDYSAKISSLNIGKIRTNSNSISMTTSCRLLPSVPEKIYRNWILDIKKLCSKKGASLKFKKHFPSFQQKKNGPWLEFLNKSHTKLDVSINNSTSAMSCTEANILAKSCIETALFGAGAIGGNTHQPNESISLKEVKSASQYYEYLISNYTL